METSWKYIPTFIFTNNRDKFENRLLPILKLSILSIYLIVNVNTFKDCDYTYGYIYTLNDSVQHILANHQTQPPKQK